MTEIFTMLTNGPSHKRAFTMIELLVVIVIIGILISLLMGALNLLQKQRKRVQTLSLMGQIETALQEYLTTYPRLGMANDSSDFINSPWTFLGRNEIALGQQPYLGTVANKFLAVGNASGPWTQGTDQTADQILDAFPAGDFSNHFIFIIDNATNNGSTYTDKIYIISTVGTPTHNDDIIRRLTTADGQWTTLTYSQSQLDTPLPTW
jgi:prepilin-type N-terminal cleavage/methylation domain-containing protein